jgi:hypothetical protein
MFYLLIKLLYAALIECAGRRLELSGYFRASGWRRSFDFLLLAILIGKCTVELTGRIPPRLKEAHHHAKLFGS